MNFKNIIATPDQRMVMFPHEDLTKMDGITTEVEKTDTTINLELEDGGLVIVKPNFLNKEIADLLFEKLKNEIPWKQETSKFGPVPRLNAWYADEGLTYSYTGIKHKGSGWHPICELAKKKVEYGSGFNFNSLLLNYYRNGGDSIGLHTDSEPNLGDNPVVASLSLGVSRKFSLRHMKKKKENSDQYLRHNMVLNHGDLLVMAGTLQHFWLHELPKEPSVTSERISLTFRRIVY